MMLADSALDQVWRYQPHPEVWLLVVSLVGLYVYMVRVLGPRAVGRGTPAVSRGNVIAFVVAMLTLWIASDWPLHDISEEYLYSAHMLQHMMLAYFLPPLALLATPEWLARVLLGDRRVYGAVRWLARPVAAALIFNAITMITHVPGVVNASVANGPLHYALHLTLVFSALMMWTPVCGPIPEFHMAPMPKMIYLFLQSVVPTVPAAWLTFADGVVYKAYGDVTVRVFGIGVTADQQLAGAIMKIAGGLFLWSIIIVMYVRKFAKRFYAENTYKPSARIPAAEIVGNDEHQLTFDEVSRAFERTPPVAEPSGR
jgi:putative membrane protein